MMMKIPFLDHGESPVAIVGFEVESMILPRLSPVRMRRRFVAAAGFYSNPYIVMEFIAGASLKARARRNAAAAPQRVADIGAKIAAALHDLHRQHVIHLDSSRATSSCARAARPR